MGRVCVLYIDASAKVLQESKNYTFIINIIYKSLTTLVTNKVIKIKNIIESV